MLGERTWKVTERSSFIAATLCAIVTTYYTIGLYYRWNEHTSPIRDDGTLLAPWWLYGLGVISVALLFASLLMMILRRRRDKGRSLLERMPDQVADAIADAKRDLNQLLYFAICQSSVQLLTSLLDQAPVEGIDSPLALGGEFETLNAAEAEFIKIIRKRLDYGSDRLLRFDSLMATAAKDAELEVEATPMAQRPTEIDPLFLRRWAITHRQCTRAVAFLEYERKEVTESLLSQRHRLLERHRELEKR